MGGGPSGQCSVMLLMILQFTGPSDHLARFPSPDEQIIQLLMLLLTKISSPKIFHLENSNALKSVSLKGGFLDMVTSTRLGMKTCQLGRGVIALELA